MKTSKQMLESFAKSTDDFISHLPDEGGLFRRRDVSSLSRLAAPAGQRTKRGDGHLGLSESHT